MESKSSMATENVSKRPGNPVWTELGTLFLAGFGAGATSFVRQYLVQ